MYLVKKRDGSYIPYDDYDHEESKKIPVGEAVKVKQERNYLHLKKTFAIMNIGFENQDKIEFFEPYRKIMIMKAGYYDEVRDKDGKPYFIPKSISYAAMSQQDFNKFYDALLIAISKDLGITVNELINEI